MPESARTRWLRWKMKLFPAWRGTGATVTYIAGDYREVRVELPLSWSSGQKLQATAIAADGKAIGSAGGTVRNGRFELHYAAELNGHAVAAYRVSLAG